MSWQEGLLYDQIRAAGHSGTHLRLLAGPGTGKTLTLTRHLIKLVLDDQVPAEQILAVAFTRINAFDLARSVKGEFNNSGLLPPRISTLHSFALSQLLRNTRLIRSLPQPLRIADDYEEKNIIRPDIGARLGLNDRQVRDKLTELSSDWQDLRLDQEPYKPADPRFMGAWKQHRDVFGYTLRAELVYQLKHAMEENPDEFNIGETIRHLLVDEYQDLNRCDLAVVAAIAAAGAEVYCAGDDDQSIYSFRGAYPEGIRRFTEEFHPSTPLVLEVCWRSDRAIIALGQYVADLDPDRLPKPIAPRPDAGQGEVHLLRFDEQLSEANGIAVICRHLIRARGYSPDDILILLRSDHQGRYSTPLREALTLADIPVSVRVEQGGPLDESPGRQLLSLLRLSQNDSDDLAWRTLLHLVRRGNQIGAATIAFLVRSAIDQRIRFSEVLAQIEASPDQFPKGAYIVAEINRIRALLAPLQGLQVPDPDRRDDIEYRAGLLEELLFEVQGIARQVIASEAECSLVMDHITRAAQRWDAISLTDLVNSITSPEDTLDQELDPGKVNILSMHRAKGLSSKAVIIAGAEEELIPGDAIGEAFNDERRLLYVSLTRAEHFLVATYCNRRTGRQKYSGSNMGHSQRNLTPFLDGALPIETGTVFVQSL